MFKKYFTSLVALSLISSLQSLTSYEVSTSTCVSRILRGKVIDDKIYLHPGMAHVTPKGLVVQVNGDFLPVPMIESDDNGVFILMQYAAGKIMAGNWCCSFCWNWNSSNRVNCGTCGSDRD